MSRDMCPHGFDLRNQGEEDYPFCVDCATPEQLRGRFVLVEGARSSEADGGSAWRQSALEMEQHWKAAEARVLELEASLVAEFDRAENLKARVVEMETEVDALTKRIGDLT